MSNFSDVPIIDISPILGHPDEQYARCAEKIHVACRDVGFLLISNHGVCANLIDSLMSVADSFFTLESSVKEKYAMINGGKAWRGWFPVGDELTMGRPDQKEGFYFGTEMSAEEARGLPLHGPNLFPDKECPKMRDIVLSYMDEMTRVASALFRALASVLLGAENRDYFEKRFTDDPTRLFRIFRYPKHEFADNDDEWGVRQHTDMGFLTILLQDDCGGLQVKNSCGDWIDCPPVPNAFVVNVGDMLQLWTKGMYRATLHRVKNKASKPRYSFPFFFDPNWNATMEPIEDLDEAKTKDDQDRWDGIDLHSVKNITYGEFVLKKVTAVFPHLAKDAEIK